MAFEKKSSTHLALLSFIDKAKQAIENGEYAICVFLDFPKAFDMVDHDILLDELDHNGIRGCALSWFKRFFSIQSLYLPFYMNIHRIQKEQITQMYMLQVSHQIKYKEIIR